MPHCHWLAVHLSESKEALEIMADFFDRKLGEFRPSRQRIAIVPDWLAEQYEFELQGDFVSGQ